MQLQTFEDYQKEFQALMVIWDNHRSLQDYEKRLKKKYDAGFSPQEAYNEIFSK